MKYVTLFAILFFATATIADAQLRQDLQPMDTYNGVISHTQSHSSSSVGDWMNMLNMTMTHSYSMTFGSFGGQMQNINAYTNTMAFDLSENLDASISMSFLHSPFGNSFMTQDNSLGSRIIIDSARLDYRLSENTRVSFEFSQRPYHYHYSPFGMHGTPRSSIYTNQHHPFWY